ERSRAIQAVVGSARPLRPSDFLALDASISDSSTVDDMETEFSARSDSAMTVLATQQGLLNQEITNLRNLIQAKQPYDLQNLRVLLNQASQFGIPGAIPFSRGGSDPLTTADLLTQGDVINQEMKRRAALANPIDAKNNPLPISAQDRLKAVFGPGF